MFCFFIKLFVFLHLVSILMFFYYYFIFLSKKGCIYEYDEAHALGSGVGFTEEEKPNFTGSFYSETKGYVDQVKEVVFCWKG